MHRIILQLSAAFLAAAAMAGPLMLGGEVELLLPPGWRAAGTAESYPFQLLNDRYTAEILVFKSLLSGDNAIGSAEELKKSVANVTEDVILSLPQAKLLTSTGYSEGNRARFVVEFVSFDTATGLELQHRLVGYIYRRYDTGQLLFTVWGKCRRDEAAAVLDDIRQVQAAFTYTGPSEPAVFAPSARHVWWTLAALFLVLVGIYLAGRRYRRFGRVAFSEDANVWRCGCGRLNHFSAGQCRRCGSVRQSKILT
jgi:hypothetical protein